MVDRLDQFEGCIFLFLLCHGLDQNVLCSVLFLCDTLFRSDEGVTSVGRLEGRLEGRVRPMDGWGRWEADEWWRA